MSGNAGGREKQTYDLRPDIKLYFIFVNPSASTKQEICSQFIVEIKDLLTLDVVGIHRLLPISSMLSSTLNIDLSSSRVLLILLILCDTFLP
ncbi:MAG: hypothetical protein M3P08_18135 [Thermoproteota archaeon]|nr:hypothetical protein [Thermoproteota archaeon]